MTGTEHPGAQGAYWLIGLTDLLSASGHLGGKLACHHGVRAAVEQTRSEGFR